MGQVILRQQTNHLQRCDLCRKVSHTIYRIPIDGMNYKFCSSIHANQAHQNFEANQARGVKPGNFSPIEIQEEVAEGDNLDTLT